MLLIGPWTLLVASCGGPSATTQPSPITTPLAISCPAPPAATVSANGQFANVTFTSATTTGGVQPVSSSCTPPSGIAFPVGSTTITCTATDKSAQAVACSFQVNVLVSPTLRVKTILAFGDSLTAGEVPDNCEFVCRQNTYPTESYPADLTTMLAARYVAQGATAINAYTLSSPNSTVCGADPMPPATAGILVINAGCNGQPAVGAPTAQLLNGAINVYHPDLVLLLLGLNDGGTAAAAQAVQTLAASIIARGIPVFVGTLPPEIQGDFSHGGLSDSTITAFNGQLQALVPQTGATLVDLYSDLAMDETDWISPYDGFHLTAAGYAEMAHVWFNAIQKAYEVTPGTPIMTTTSRRNVFRPPLSR